jgi:hypothetical protein
MTPKKIYDANMSMIEALGAITNCPIAKNQPHKVTIGLRSGLAAGIFKTEKDGMDAANRALNAGCPVYSIEQCPPKKDQARVDCEVCGCPHIYKQTGSALQ